MYIFQILDFKAMKFIKRMSFNLELSTISISDTSNNLVIRNKRKKLKEQILYKIQ